MENLHIAVLEGTTREARKSIHVAKLIAKVGSDIEGVETKLVDPADFNFPFDGNDDSGKDPAYTKIVEKADAFFVVVPEYNHSFPGSLKRMMDSELKLYVHKPIAFAGVSSGPWGGVRAIESLVNAVREMGLVATFRDVQFPSVQKLFEDDGTLKDEKYVTRVQRAYNELIWMTKAMKHARENIEEVETTT